MCFVVITSLDLLSVFEGHKVEVYILGRPTTQIIKCPFHQTDQGQKRCLALSAGSQKKTSCQHFGRQQEAAPADQWRQESAVTSRLPLDGSVWLASWKVTPPPSHRLVSVFGQHFLSGVRLGGERSVEKFLLTNGNQRQSEFLFVCLFVCFHAALIWFILWEKPDFICDIVR